jgi:hypothetical protein
MAEGPNEDPDEKKPWEERVKKLQQFFYEVFGDRDWDRYEKNEMEYLERNVGHAVFGPPQELPDEKNGGTGTELLIDFFFFFLTEWCCDRFFSHYFIFPCQYHSTIALYSASS